MLLLDCLSFCLLFYDESIFSFRLSFVFPVCVFQDSDHDLNDQRVLSSHAILLSLLFLSFFLVLSYICFCV